MGPHGVGLFSLKKVWWRVKKNTRQEQKSNRCARKEKNQTKKNAFGAQMGPHGVRLVCVPVAGETKIHGRSKKSTKCAKKEKNQKKKTKKCHWRPVFFKKNCGRTGVEEKTKKIACSDVIVDITSERGKKQKKNSL